MKKKSPFLSAFGTAFQIFKALTDAVLDIGGEDDDVRRILIDTDLRRDLATRIVASRNRPNPETSILDAALEQIEKREEERERPKREEDAEIAKFAEELWAWSSSNEGQKAAKLLNKSQAEIRMALDSTGSSHLRSHPNLDECMKNMEISTDRSDCENTAKWWYNHRRGSISHSPVEFYRHQMHLIAELQQLPLNNDPLWLGIRMRNAFGSDPRAVIRIEPGDKQTDNWFMDVSIGEKYVAVEYGTVDGRDGFHFFDNRKSKKPTHCGVRWKEDAFRLVSLFLTE